jgi:hypothetical protein
MLHFSCFCFKLKNFLRHPGIHFTTPLRVKTHQIGNTALGQCSYILWLVRQRLDNEKPLNGNKTGTLCL